jgi:hypothetical protein
MLILQKFLFRKHLTILKRKIFQGTFFYNFSSKGNDEEDYERYKNIFFSNKETEGSLNDGNANEDQQQNSYTKYKKYHWYLYKKRNELTDNFKKDLLYFKFNENFQLIDLRKKYLELAKLYHPDMRNLDTYSNIQFNKLQESYERLKLFCELREKIQEMEENLLNNSQGIVIDEMSFSNFEENIDRQLSKKEYIEMLCK